MKTGIELIAEERQRQIVQEGWTKEHDAKHCNGELAMAAVSYAIEPHQRPHYSPDVDAPPYTWPFHKSCWKPTPYNRIKELVKAGALIAAEIDRLQRVEEDTK